MKAFISSLIILFVITGCSQKDKTTVITEHNKDGLINDEGELIVKPIYKKAYYLDNPLSNDYEHPHYINFHWIHVADEKYAIVKNIDNKFGIIDENGQLHLKVIFDSIGQFFNGFAKIEVHNKFGLINEDFEIVLKPIYDDIRNVLNGAIIVKNFDKKNIAKYGCLNTNMNEVLPMDYDMIYLSRESRMRIEKNGLWGFIDTQCNMIAKPVYSYADDYSKGFARVQKGKLWTYLNHDGKEIERKTFSHTDNF